MPQDEREATYAAKIEKRETALDWSRPAVHLERAVRAFRPSPGAVGSLHGERLKIWKAHAVETSGLPGSVLSVDDALIVACGVGALAITELQRPGRNRVSAKQFILGHRLQPGARFEITA